MAVLIVYYVYYIGGPNDQMKRALPDLPKFDIERVAELVPASSFVSRGVSETTADYTVHDYYLERIRDRVFVAIHSSLRY